MNDAINLALENFRKAKQLQVELDKEIISLGELRNKLLQERGEKEQRVNTLLSADADSLIYGDSKTLKETGQIKAALLLLDDRVAAIDNKIGHLKSQLADAYLATKNARDSFNSIYMDWLKSEAMRTIQTGLAEALKPAAGFIKVGKKILGHNVFESIERSFFESRMEQLIIDTLSELSRSSEISEAVLLPGAEEVVFQGFQPASLSHEEINLLGSPAGRHKLKMMNRPQ